VPYIANIPQPADLLSISQPQILGNFTAINSWVGVNHVGFNVSDAGKHNFVELVSQSGTPSSLAGEALIYNANFPQTSTAEIWFLMPQTGFNYPVSNCILSTNANPGLGSNGWQYGSGGTLEKWGRTTLGSGTNTINMGAFGPAFSVNPWNVQLTAGNLIAATGNVVSGTTTSYYVSNITTTTLTIVNANSGAIVYWRVIGA